MVEKILEVVRDVEVVSLLTRSSGAATLWSRAYGRTSDAPTTAGASGPTWTATSWSPVRGPAGCRLSGGSCLSSSITLVNKRKRAADAQVNDKRSRRLAKVTRNDCLT